MTKPVIRRTVRERQVRSAAPAPDTVREMPIREEGPRRERKFKGLSHIDKFHVPAPPGWTYEWKRISVAGASDPSYENQVKAQGWTNVPVSRHPDLMPDGAKGDVHMDGLALMERPEYLTQEARAEENLAARQVVQFKEQQLGAAPPGTFERSNKDQPMAKVTRTYERGIPIDD